VGSVVICLLSLPFFFAKRHWWESNLSRFPFKLNFLAEKDSLRLSSSCFLINFLEGSKSERASGGMVSEVVNWRREI